MLKWEPPHWWPTAVGDSVLTPYQMFVEAADLRQRLRYQGGTTEKVWVWQLLQIEYVILSTIDPWTLADALATQHQIFCTASKYMGARHNVLRHLAEQPDEYLYPVSSLKEFVWPGARDGDEQFHPVLYAAAKFVGYDRKPNGPWRRSEALAAIRCYLDDPKNQEVQPKTVPADYPLGALHLGLEWIDGWDPPKIQPEIIPPTEKRSTISLKAPEPIETYPFDPRTVSCPRGRIEAALKGGLASLNDGKHALPATPSGTPQLGQDVTTYLDKWKEVLRRAKTRTPPPEPGSQLQRWFLAGLVNHEVPLPPAEGEGTAGDTR